MTTMIWIFAVIMLLCGIATFSLAQFKDYPFERAAWEAESLIWLVGAMGVFAIYGVVRLFG